jgi:hypothetical protein
MHELCHGLIQLQRKDLFYYKVLYVAFVFNNLLWTRTVDIIKILYFLYHKLKCYCFLFNLKHANSGQSNIIFSSSNITYRDSNMKHTNNITYENSYKF